ncbi:MAG: hypothetical protein KJ621_08985 [Proteobacteria bacterium]|nr:hypothetical protein [Pseudomonadota bacterium]MBU1741240.1 hypothetical protein [Pseudomonadota bacterium]
MTRRLVVCLCLVLVICAPGAEAAGRTVYVVGRVKIRFDGWQGRRDTVFRGLVVQITRRYRQSGVQRSQVHTAQTDPRGFFYLRRVPRQGAYLVSLVHHPLQGWDIAGKGGIAASVGRDKRIIVLGTYEYVIDKQGRVRSRVSLKDPRKFLQNFRRVPGLRRLIRRMRR